MKKKTLSLFLLVTMIFIPSCSDSKEIKQMERNLNAVIITAQGKKVPEKIDENKTNLTADEYLNNAYQKTLSGDTKGAIEDYTQAIKLDPKFITAYNNRARARKSLGDIKGAIEDYNMSLKLDSNVASTYQDRALCKIDLKHYEDAIKDFSLAIKYSNSTSWQAYYNRGLTRLYLGQDKEADNDFKLSIKNGGDSSSTYGAAALTKLRLGKFNDAKKYYDLSK